MFDVKTSSKCSYIGLPHTYGEFKNKSKKQPRGKSGYSLCFPGHRSLSRLHQRKLCKETQPGNPTGQNQKLIELVNTKGKTMKVLGTTKITIQAPGGGWTTTVALVCPQLLHEFLLLWIMQKKLQLLHAGLPFTSIVGANSATLLEVNYTPKRLQPREKNPEPQSPK